VRQRELAAVACVWWAALSCGGALASPADLVQPTDFAVRAAREQERAQLLAVGQARLTAGDGSSARDAFEHAALLRHAPDAEVALVRAYMQAGQYRQALRVAAHSSAHLEYPEAALLYAHLLRAGGQADVAAKMVTPPLADARVSTRLGPYEVPADLVPADAHSTGTGLVIGAVAIAPLQAVQGAGALWLRNGVGQAARASVLNIDHQTGLALLKLDDAMPSAPKLELGARDAYAGSAAAVIGYAESRFSAPVWPALRFGFLMRLPGSAGGVGIEPATGRRDGPVFDAAGRVIGFAVAEGASMARVIGIRQLAALWGAELAVAPTSSDPRPRLELDVVYEAALNRTVQVLRQP
jgi:S1-C subfamily serine protease